MTNQYEKAHRAEKVAALVALIMGICSGDPTEGHLAIIRTWDAEEWAAMAARAGVNPPSDETVVCVIRALERAGRVAA